MMGEQLLKDVDKVFKLWYELRDVKVSRKEFQAEIEPIEQRVNALLKEGSVSEHKKTRHTCERVLK